MKIGIMGGTFDPIHIGHLTLAECAKDTLQLDEVWFIPTGISYKKANKSVLPGKERLYMTKLSTEDKAFFRCLDIEVNREGYTYSYETLEQLKREYPTHAFYFIVGSDCLMTIENWKYPKRFFDCCTLAAATRGEMDFEVLEKKKAELEALFSGRIVLFPFINMDVSSTMIRSRVQCGESISDMVSEKVEKYIKEKGFYRETKKYAN